MTISGVARVIQKARCHGYSAKYVIKDKILFRTRSEPTTAFSLSVAAMRSVTLKVMSGSWMVGGCLIQSHQGHWRENSIGACRISYLWHHCKGNWIQRSVSQRMKTLPLYSLWKEDFRTGSNFCYGTIFLNSRLLINWRFHTVLQMFSDSSISYRPWERCCCCCCLKHFRFWHVFFSFLLTLFFLMSDFLFFFLRKPASVYVCRAWWDGISTYVKNKCLQIATKAFLHWRERERWWVLCSCTPVHCVSVQVIKGFYKNQWFWSNFWRMENNTTTPNRSMTGDFLSTDILNRYLSLDPKQFRCVVSQAWVGKWENKSLIELERISTATLSKKEK